MSRRVVSEIQCSRCARVETGSAPAVPHPAIAQPEVPAAFVVTLGTHRIQFEDLCGPCTKAVKTHLDAIGKKIDGLSPARAERKPKAPAKQDVAVIDTTGKTLPFVKKAKDA